MPNFHEGYVRIPEPNDALRTDAPQIRYLRLVESDDPMDIMSAISFAEAHLTREDVRRGYERLFDVHLERENFQGALLIASDFLRDTALEERVLSMVIQV